MIKNNKGFSLIEVLVTVGLIGILVGIAIPSYNQYKRNTLAMAIKSDIGNGHKAYSAYDAINGTYCATLDQVGMQVEMTSQTYRKKGAYGFGAINSDCGGTPSDVKLMSFKNTGVCLHDDDGNAHSSITTETDCTVTDYTWQKDNEFEGNLDACELGSDNFDLGAYTNTSALNTFVVINEAGKIVSSSGNTCAPVP